MSAGQAPAAPCPPSHLLHLPWGLTPWTVLSQPHFSSSPLLHARVTAKATPAEEMAYTKAASRVPVGGRGRAGLGPSAPLCTLRSGGGGVWDLIDGGARSGTVLAIILPTRCQVPSLHAGTALPPCAERFLFSAREVSAVTPVLQRSVHVSLSHGMWLSRQTGQLHCA